MHFTSFVTRAVTVSQRSLGSYIPVHTSYGNSPRNGHVCTLLRSQSVAVAIYRRPGTEPSEWLTVVVVSTTYIIGTR